MTGPRAGPRKYRVFVCHRYKHDEVFGQLRVALNRAKYFNWRHVGLPAEKRLSLSPQGLKAAITNRIKKSDVMLVLAHSAGGWVEHELEKAEQYRVPVIAVVDPVRANTPHKWAITSNVREAAAAIVSLDQPDEIVGCIRKHTRPRPYVVAQNKKTQGISKAEQGLSDTVSTPRDIAVKIASTKERPGLFSTIGSFFFRGSSRDRSSQRLD